MNPFDDSIKSAPVTEELKQMHVSVIAQISDGTVFDHSLIVEMKEHLEPHLPAFQSIMINVGDILFH